MNSAVSVKLGAPRLISTLAMISVIMGMPQKVFRKNVLIIHDGTSFGDFGIEIVTRMLELCLSKPFEIKASVITHREFSEHYLDNIDLAFLTNVTIPGQPQFNIPARIFDYRPELPFLVSSAISSPKGHPHAYFVKKPFLLEELMDAVINLLFFRPARLSQEGLRLIQIEGISQEIIDHLAKHSEDLFNISDRFFEELVAEILYSQGWEVELTPISADGGIDIIAIKRKAEFPHLMLVQAKRYSKQRKVGISAIREILHVVDDYKATSTTFH